MKHRALFIAALIAGISYFFADRVIADGPLQWAWKGAGVGLLALWAGLQARTTDGWLLTALLAVGALGDVVLDAAGMTAGGAVFLIAHLISIWLYLRNRRANPSFSQTALALTVLVATPLTGFLLPVDRPAAPGMAIYAGTVAAMAAAAWLSRFPRYRVGLGAMLFVVSDLLILARAGPLSDSILPDLMVWPTYFAAQALIAWGVAGTLRPVASATDR